MSRQTEQLIEGRTIQLSNLDKVLYPDAGFSKAAVLDYYARIAPVLLPHLKGRPLTLRRYPNGVEGHSFFEKNCPRFHPSWMKMAPIWSEGKNTHTNYCVVNDLASLIWVANLASLELHPSLSRARKMEQPTAVAFDLDPGLPADVVTCARVALMLHELLCALGLKSFPKTSGSKGLQVYVPLNTPVTYDQTKAFALGMAQLMERRHPRLVLSRMTKALRTGKVFVDWSQNDIHKTTVVAYSLRARPRPTVSAPVTWAEVERAVKSNVSEALQFESDAVLKRVATDGDLFAPVLRLKQRLPSFA